MAPPRSPGPGQESLQQMRNLRILLAAVMGACVSMTAVNASAASPRLFSVGFNSSRNNPQQIGADAFKQELDKHFKGRISVDERGTNSFGSENALVAGMLSGALDVAIVTGPTIGPVVPEFGVFDVPFPVS